MIKQIFNKYILFLRHSRTRKLFIELCNNNDNKEQFSYYYCIIAAQFDKVPIGTRVLKINVRMCFETQNMMGFEATAENVNGSEKVLKYDVTHYGADRTGRDLCTMAISFAIDAAQHNGMVYFPPGYYRTGPIHLKSNTTIYIETDAFITFSDDFDDYLPMVRTRWEGIELNNFSPLIYADNASNIAIRGHGVLDGSGKKWWDFNFKLIRQFNQTKRVSMSKWQREFSRVNDTSLLETLVEDPTKLTLGFLRPPFIQFIDCKNIVIRDVTITNSPFWTINPVYCENVIITGLNIKAPCTPANTDGINPDSSKNVHISNCVINVGGDCIGIKSGRDLQGRLINRPSENITITDCKLLGGYSGIAVGTEHSGDVRNITVTHCFFRDIERGIYIKSMRGRGGKIENLNFSDIEMENILRVAVIVSQQVEYFAENSISDRTPIIRDIFISSMKCRSPQSVIMLGLKESPIENVSISDSRIVANEGIIANNTKQMQLKNFTLITY